eukprot:m.354192 g.354192  ORF g.354192 m.354192 type:complete len:211 (+) comp16948_c0_seq1:350-982(+)
MKLVLALTLAWIAMASARSCKSRNTCKNNGLCKDVVRDDDPSRLTFKCECAAGFGGERCENVVTPQNWAKIGDCEYFAVKQPVLSYGDANAACARQGGVLARFTDSTIENKVASLISEDEQAIGRWIGLKRNKVGVFGWEDGTAFDHAGYTNWFPTYPGRDNEQCVLQDYRDGAIGWATHKCREEKRYICQRCPTTATKTKRRRRRRRNN